MIAQFNKFTASIGRRIRLLVSRGVVNHVDDGLKQQNMQVSLLADETADDVERFQNYGHSSVPPAGSEAIVLAVGGVRQHLVAVVVDAKGVRPVGLESGDSVVYHLEGHNVLLTKDGVIRVTCKRLEFVVEEKIVFDCPQTEFTGDVGILGVSTAEDHSSAGISGKGHKHKEHDGHLTDDPE